MFIRTLNTIEYNFYTITDIERKISSDFNKTMGDIISSFIINKKTN